MNEPAAGRRGIPFVFAGASGAGKSSVCRHLVEAGLGRFSISHTSRPRSDQEVDGVHYHFVDQARFQEMVAAGALAEWAHVHGEYYGTGRQWLDAQRAAGHDIFLDIDVQGASQLRASLDEVVTVFLLPTSMADLERRLRQRRRDDDAQIARRLAAARAETAHAPDFDYLIVNDDLARTTALAEAIVRHHCGTPGLARAVAGCRPAAHAAVLATWQASAA